MPPLCKVLVGPMFQFKQKQGRSFTAFVFSEIYLAVATLYGLCTVYLQVLMCCHHYWETCHEVLKAKNVH